MGRCRRKLAGARRKPADALPALPGRLRGRANPGPRALQGGGRRLLTISGGRVLSPEGGFERRGLAVADGAHRGCHRPRRPRFSTPPGSGPARHRGYPRRRLRTPDHAAAGRAFPARCGVAGHRPADGGQRHHHGVSCGHLVLGAGAARARHAGGADGGAGGAGRAAGRGYAPASGVSRPSTWTPWTNFAAGTAAGKVDLLAFNDHFEEVREQCRDREKIGKYADRAGLTHGAFLDLLEAVGKGAAEVPAALRRIAAAARGAGVVLLAHDEETLEDRSLYRSLGASISEFPEIETVARNAVEPARPSCSARRTCCAAGAIPARPRPPTWCARASALCWPRTTTTPALLAGALPAGGAWHSEAGGGLAAGLRQPRARAAGLDDRGTLAEGRRADILLVDPSGPVPRPAAVLAGAGCCASGSVDGSGQGTICRPSRPAVPAAAARPCGIRGRHGWRRLATARPAGCRAGRDRPPRPARRRPCSETAAAPRSRRSRRSASLTQL